MLIVSSHRQWKTRSSWKPLARTATWSDFCSTSTTPEWTCAPSCRSPTAAGTSAQRWRTTSRWKCVWRAPSATPASPSSPWRRPPGATERCKPLPEIPNMCNIAEVQTTMKPFVSEITSAKFRGSFLLYVLSTESYSMTVKCCHKVVLLYCQMNIYIIISIYHFSIYCAEWHNFWLLLNYLNYLCAYFYIRNSAFNHFKVILKLHINELKQFFIKLNFFVVLFCLLCLV